MEDSEVDPQTPCFGPYRKNKNLIEELLGKRIPNSTNDVSKYVKYDEKSKNSKKEKSKSKKKNKDKSKSKDKSKEKSKSKRKYSKPKNKKVSAMSSPLEQKYENPFDNFLKKRIDLRNDFDQINSDKFLSEKELAFQQFRINEDADYLEN